MTIFTKATYDIRKMTKNDRLKLLKEKLKALAEYQSILSNETLGDFNILKQDILELLDDNQKIRFNQIKFYSEVQDYSNFGIDDLPFVTNQSILKNRWL
jgi:ribosomal protein L29